MIPEIFKGSVIFARHVIKQEFVRAWQMTDVLQYEDLKYECGNVWQNVPIYVGKSPKTSRNTKSET